MRLWARSDLLLVAMLMSQTPNISANGSEVTQWQYGPFGALYSPDEPTTTGAWHGGVGRLDESGLLLEVANFRPEAILLKDRDDVPDKDKIGMICSKININDSVKEKLGVTSSGDDENHIDEIICGTANFVSPCELVTSYHVPLREIPLNMWKQGSVSAYFAVGWGKFHPGSKLGSGPDFEHHTELALIDASMYISAADPDHSPEIDHSNDCAYFKLKNCIEGDPEHSFSDYFRMAPLAPADLIGLRCKSVGFTGHSTSQLLYDPLCGFPPTVVDAKNYPNRGIQNICSSNYGTSGAAIQCVVNGMHGIVAIQSGVHINLHTRNDQKNLIRDNSPMPRNTKNFRNMAAPLDACPKAITQKIMLQYSAQQ